MEKTLLAVVELGGYPNFTPLYERLGYRVITEQAGRKALAAAKKGPSAVVAEFNYQREFRDRTSALESLLATLAHGQTIPVVVFFDPIDAAPLAQLRARFPGFVELPYPIDTAALERALAAKS